ncbi:putative phospholipase D [Helianthus annuus]|nr:putative phospholipase D [Helianthus annuus]
MAIMKAVQSGNVEDAIEKVNDWNPEFKWQLVKKASHVFYLHFALKKRAFFEEIHEKQEQVCLSSHKFISSSGNVTTLINEGSVKNRCSIKCSLTNEEESLGGNILFLIEQRPQCRNT